MSKETKVSTATKAKAFITNVKEMTGVISLADQVQNLKTGKVLGIEVINASGKAANKVSYFKIKGWALMDKTQRAEALKPFLKSIGKQVPVCFTTPSSDEEGSKFYNIEFI
tara:strand:+ start:126 stop:458 length:333 start_codon:yes stop_codon:yes gene_type:complete